MRLRSEINKGKATKNTQAKKEGGPLEIIKYYRASDNALAALEMLISQYMSLLHLTRYYFNTQVPIKTHSCLPRDDDVE
jgi:hypothetical protein